MSHSCSLYLLLTFYLLFFFIIIESNAYQNTGCTRVHPLKCLILDVIYFEERKN